MASGIESLHRINAVDLGNHQVAASVGTKFRASMIGAAGTSS